MTRLFRWIGFAVASILGLTLIAATAVWLISVAKLSARVEPKREHLVQPTPAQLGDAERVGRSLGCFSCHGEGLSGKKMFDVPNVGTIWAPNLTLIAAKATDDQLARAIRQGIGVDGRSLFVMPSEAFQHLPDQETAALVAMIRKQPKGGTDTPPNVFGPLGRLGVVFGKFKTAPQLVDEYTRKEPILLGPQLEAGRQLSMTNCSSCHNADLTGKEVKPGVTSPDLILVGAYDQPAFTRLLRTGVPPSGKALGMMGPTARSDFSHMTDAEIGALYAYLQARAGRLSR